MRADREETIRHRWLLAVPATLAFSGCAAKIDRMTLDRIVDRASDYSDTGKVCALGSAFVHPLGSLTKNEPHRALIVAEGTAALCAEQVAWAAELDAARVKRNGVSLGDARAAEITDARLRAERAHTAAAARFEAAFRQTQAEWGTVGAGCPALPDEDEFAYLFGLVSGTLALLHDRQGGGHNGVPMDRLSAIARGAECLDDADWWSTPSALRGAAWATIPGSGPADVDPWALLEKSAAAGEPSGVRVARAMQVLIAANAGRDDVLAPAIRAHAAALEATPRDAEWALLDAYAQEVSLQQSDLLWTAAQGHRTERFGKLPGDDALPVTPAGPDPFSGADPFGGAPSSPDPSPESPAEAAPPAQEETP